MILLVLQTLALVMSSQTKRDPYELVCDVAYDKPIGIFNHFTVPSDNLCKPISEFQRNGGFRPYILKKLVKREGARAWTTGGTCLEL